MKNRVLLAIALVAIGIAMLAWWLGDRATTRPDASARTIDAAEAARAADGSQTLEAGALAASSEAPRQEAASAAGRDLAPERDGFPFLGRVVDARTGEPVARALARVLAAESGLQAPTDDEGRFAGRGRIPPDFTGLAFFNAYNPNHIRNAERERLEWIGDGEGWLARILVGPTYRFRLVGAGSLPPTGWKLRVVESAPGKPDREWVYVDAAPGDPFFARYDNPGPDPEPGSSARIEVENAEGTLRGSAPIVTTSGIHPGVLSILIDEDSARVAGRVITDAGNPMEHAQVFAVSRRPPPDADEGWPSVRTDGEGRYSIGGLAPGEHWIHARPRRGEAPQTIELLLPAGLTTAPDIVVTAEAYGGAIEGLLKSRTGQSFPAAVVRLRRIDGPSFDHYDLVDPERQQDVGRAELEQLRRTGAGFEPKGFFEFQSLPEGEYELTVISPDGRRWTPSPLRVRPPNRELEIFRDDDAGQWQAAFRVLDATTGDPIQFFWAQRQMEDCWSGEVDATSTRETVWTFAEGARFRWNVHATGYRLASGTESDFEASTDPRIATVKLERGYGARFLFRDAQGLFAGIGNDWRGRVAVLERPPVAGVQVFADGELAATSDGRGIAMLETASEPARIEVRASGWTVLGSDMLRDGRTVGDCREIVVWLAR